MNIKNIILFSLLCITHCNVNAMETMLSNEEIDFLNLTTTSQYQAYIKALNIDYTDNSSETRANLDNAWKNLLNTEDLKNLFYSKKYIYGDNSTTYLSIIETSQYDIYDQAKNLHHIHGNNASKIRLEEALKHLLETPEVQNMASAKEKILAFYGPKDFVNVMTTSDLKGIAQTSKFQKMIHLPNFSIILQAPELQEYIKAIHSQSYIDQEKALETLLATETMLLMFETGMLSDNTRTKHNDMQKTDVYQKYQKAKKDHEAFNISETQMILDSCSTKLHLAKEYVELLNAINKDFVSDTQKEAQYNNNNNNSNTHSDVYTKSRAMAETQEWQDFQQAKTNYKRNPSEDTACIVKLYEEALHNTNEYQQHLKAVSQKTRILVKKTPEYLQYREAKLSHKKNKTADTFYLLEMCTTELHDTKEYKDWMKHQQGSSLPSINLIKDKTNNTSSQNLQLQLSNNNNNNNNK